MSAGRRRSVPVIADRVERMGFAHAVRWFHTVRYLRALQVCYRIYYRFRPWARVVAQTGMRRRWPLPWPSAEPMPPTMLARDVFEFLGERGSIQSTDGWKGGGRSRLWVYNLHYLDDLNAEDSRARAAEHRRLVSRWIAENPPGKTAGWEPYPLSLRIVNLVKWFARQQHLDPQWASSLAVQAQVLSRNLEYHLLGNHLFANAKALIFAGAFLDGEPAGRWLRKGLQLLDAQIVEQFLADGGHFERSPMYHSALLWDLCDLLSLAQASGVPELAMRRPSWGAALTRGICWLAAMTHPDGEIGFFNDAAFGIAPRLAAIQQHAERLLGSPVASSPSAGPVACRLLEESGYCRVDLPHRGVAILDLAPVGPDYLPAHAHADTLSFELSLFGERVFVNSGTSLYAESAERLRQRGTGAHNTVVVDGLDSSEVWAGFRVGQRARVRLHTLRQSVQEIVVAASHDGYRRLPGRNVHRRQWTFRAASLQIEDELEGRCGDARAYFHLHPGITITEQDPAAGSLVLRSSQGIRIDFSVTGGTLVTEGTTWHPRFGASIPSRRLVATLDSAPLRTSIRWRRDL